MCKIVHNFRQSCGPHLYATHMKSDSHNCRPFCALSSFFSPPLMRLSLKRFSFFSFFFKALIHRNQLQIAELLRFFQGVLVLLCLVIYLFICSEGAAILVLVNHDVEMLLCCKNTHEQMHTLRDRLCQLDLAGFRPTSECFK